MGIVKYDVFCVIVLFGRRMFLLVVMMVEMSVSWEIIVF